MHFSTFNGWLVEMPTILDSLFHKVVNTTSSPIGVGGGGWWGAIEVVGTSDTKTFLWLNGFNSGCFQLYMSQNVATLMPSLTNQFCSDSLLAIGLARKVGAIYRLPEHL